MVKCKTILYSYVDWIFFIKMLFYLMGVCFICHALSTDSALKSSFYFKIYTTWNNETVTVAVSKIFENISDPTLELSS